MNDNESNLQTFAIFAPLKAKNVAFKQKVHWPQMVSYEEKQA